MWHPALHSPHSPTVARERLVMPSAFTRLPCRSNNITAREEALERLCRPASTNRQRDSMWRAARSASMRPAAIMATANQLRWNLLLSPETSSTPRISPEAGSRSTAAEQDHGLIPAQKCSVA